MKKQSSSDAVSSSSSAIDLSHPPSSSSSEKPLCSSSISPAEDHQVGSSRDGSGGAQEIVAIDRRGEYTAVCRWTVENFTRVKAKALWSKYFDVGGYDCRLLVYPRGDSQALPGYISIYLQIMDPRGTSSSRWDCFASYRLSIVNHVDESLTIHKDSWHRFSSKKKSHGWCDFTLNSSVLDPKMGFLFNNDSLLITADILILNESVSFSRDSNSDSGSLFKEPGPLPDVLSGKFTWKVNNFSLFKEMIKTQKIMSPVFPAGECNLRISVYQSVVNSQEYISMCLESKETDKTMASDRSCWCLFRMSALNQKPGCAHMHRDSYGRFAADNKNGDNTSLGWNDYMKMSDFVNPESGFLLDDTAVFSTSFHVIKEFSSFTKNGGLVLGRNNGNGSRKSDAHMGRFTWKIENFTRLKDLLKKRKITGLCIKSRRFQIGNRDCRLIVYPRGQSQPPCHLSVFLEVTDSRSSSDWSCFVSHRLSVVNQRLEEKSVTKESQNRYSKAAKDWGWREFVTLTSLFDQDSGFLVQDTVVFSAEVLILKETSVTKDYVEAESANSASQIDSTVKRSSFTWKVENFLAFKEIMETRKIFSKFFQAGGCELRIGVYESFDTICIYLESDQSAGTDVDNNFWVKYKMGILNQKNPAKSVWKESSICTKTWNNSVLQFMKVSDMLEADAGFLVRDTVVFVCEVLDCCPWFEFSDLEVLASDDDQDALTTDPDEIIDSEESEGISGDEEDTFQDFLSQAGFHLTFGENPSQPQVTLREKLLMDAGAIAGFLTGLRVYLDDPTKVKRLLLPTKISCNDRSKLTKSDESSPSLMNLLMGVKVLQQAIIDLLLDIMVECCQPSEEEGSHSEPSLMDAKTDGCVASPSLESTRENGAAEPLQYLVDERFKSDADATTLSTSAVEGSGMNGIDMLEKALTIEPVSPPETYARQSSDAPGQSKTKWPEQSEELLGLIVNSLKTLDSAVPQGCPEPRRRPHSAQKIALVLNRAPKHLQPDLVSLVPKLVEHSEHPLAAYALIERLQTPDAEPALREPVYNALSQLDCDSEVWEHILLQSFELLSDSNGESLVAAIHFIFKTASQCQHLPEAVRSVRERLKVLGADVSVCVLEYLSKTVHSWAEIAEMILKDINCDDSLGGNFVTLPCGPFLIGENETTSEMADLMDEHEFYANRQFCDVYILLEMLSISCLAVEASQTFERAVARGAIVAQSVAMVLEKRRVQGPNLSATSGDPVLEGEASDEQAAEGIEFRGILNLAETLAHSGDPQVRGFVKMLYTILFKWFPDQPFRVQMLTRLVDRFTSRASGSNELDLELEVLAILIFQEQEVARPVLAMLKKVVEHANIDRAALWHQLRANKEELVRLKEEKKTEIQNLAKEKSAITQKLSESEAANTRLKSEMKAETDRFTREKKDLVEQFRDVESQLEWVRSEREDEIAKLSSDKKSLLNRLLVLLMISYHLCVKPGSTMLRERSGSIWSLILSRNMGGGPRTFPGGLNKWQWKRMHEKKAREKENKLLDQEKQLYEARIRSEIRAKMLGGNHDSNENTAKSNQSHGPLSPQEHIKSLADRFMKAGAEDLWNEDDGPVKKTNQGSRLNRVGNGGSRSNSPIDVRSLVGRRGFSSMSHRGRFKRNESSCDEGEDFDSKKFDTLSPFSPGFAGKKEKVKSVSNVMRNKGLFGRRKFRKNDSSTEEDSEEEDGKMNGWMDVRRTGSSASLGNHDFKLIKRVQRNVTDEDLYPPLDINGVRDDLSKRKSVENVMEVNGEPRDSIYSGRRFDESSVSPLTLKALSASGIVKMTRVQDATLSECFEGQDALVKAKTGTGKSMAFLLPAIETVLKAMASSNGVHRVPPILVLILCPTRELASQIAAEGKALLKYHDGIGVQTLIGGTRFKLDQQRLQSDPCQILIATPGRLLDHIENKSNITSRLMALKLFVVDEADLLLDLGFRRDVEKIIDCLPRQRQSLLFSATIPKEVRRVSQLVLKRDHSYIDTIGLGCVETHDKVKQSCLVAPHESHFHLVPHLLKEHINNTADYKIIVFCSTGMVTSLMYTLLREMKLNVREIHARKPQLHRTRVSDEFKESKRLILVTSDVSARGMNYPDVTLVIQVGIPSDREQYIHRLGRTGREGKGGKGLLLIAPWERYFLDELKDLPIEPIQVPDLDSRFKLEVDQSMGKIDTSIKEAAYHAWLGYYNSVRETGRDKTTLAELANRFCYSIGLEKPPPLFRKTAVKMGLKGISGIPIRK